MSLHFSTPAFDLFDDITYLIPPRVFLSSLPAVRARSAGKAIVLGCPQTSQLLITPACYYRSIRSWLCSGKPLPELV